MENGRISQRISLRPKISERQVVNPKTPSPHPKPPHESKEGGVPTNGFIRGFFGERSLLFLGVITSILALTMSLWSIHKNSDVARRLNSLNSSVVDLIVRQKAAPVVEVGRRVVHSENATKFDKFKERREAKKQETNFQNPFESTVKEIQLFNEDQERDRVLTLEKIRRESEENIRRMELASREALMEGEKHKLTTRQLTNKVSQLQVKQPVSEPITHGADKLFDSISQVGDALLNKTSKQRFVDDVDVDDLERDLQLLTGQ